MNFRWLLGLTYCISVSLYVRDKITDLVEFVSVCVIFHSRTEGRTPTVSGVSMLTRSHFMA